MQVCVAIIPIEGVRACLVSPLLVSPPSPPPGVTRERTGQSLRAAIRVTSLPTCSPDNLLETDSHLASVIGRFIAIFPAAVLLLIVEMLHFYLSASLFLNFSLQSPSCYCILHLTDKSFADTAIVNVSLQ